MNKSSINRIKMIKKDLNNYFFEILKKEKKKKRLEF